LYAKDADKFNDISVKLGTLRNRLEEAEQRWLELEELRQNLLTQGGDA
jgi:hypothetical protein